MADAPLRPEAETTRAPTDTDDLAAVIREFEAALPGWWWSVCPCNLTRDASCGPDFRDARCSVKDVERFDDGFHCDSDGTLADALRDVMQQALAAKAEAAREKARDDDPA